MRLTRAGLMVSGMVLAVVVSSSPAQDAQQNPDNGNRRQGRRSREAGNPDGQRRGGSDRGGRRDSSNGTAGRPDRGSRGSGQGDAGRRDGGQRDGGGGPRFGRGRGPRPDFSTPEGRERFYSHMVDDYADRMGRHYELSDAQKTQVRSQLENIKAKQVAYSQQHSQEFDSLRNEMRQAWESGQPDRARMEEIGKKFQTLRENSPLMNRERVTQEIEKLLPADQVERGRARHQAEDNERRQRFEQMRQQWQQRRGQGGDQADDAQAASSNSAAAGGDAVPGSPGEGDPGSRFGRGGIRFSRGDFGRGGSRRGSWGRGGDEAGGAEQVSGAVVDAGPEGQRSRQLIRENPISPWEQYVRDFITLYKLDPAQQGTAWSILREMQERRTAHEQSHRVDYEQARQIENSRDREKRLAELNAPVVRSFEELKSRLIRIPSSAQRQAAGWTPPSSQPAAASTRPSQ